MKRRNFLALSGCAASAAILSTATAATGQAKGVCSRSAYAEIPIYVNGVEVMTRTSPDPSAPPSDTQWSVIENTLALVPSRHLQLLSDPGYVQVSKSNCLPGKGGGNGGGDRWIRLSSDSLSKRYNRTYNVTLLHELGHLVDVHYSAMRTLKTQDREGYRLLINTPHDGETSGDGEHFADCYMIYLLQVVAGHRYVHPIAPEAYRGEEAQRRFRVLLSSPAFS